MNRSKRTRTRTRGTDTKYQINTKAKIEVRLNLLNSPALPPALIIVIPRGTPHDFRDSRLRGLRIERLGVRAFGCLGCSNIYIYRRDINIYKYTHTHIYIYGVCINRDGQLKPQVKRQRSRTRQDKNRIEKNRKE